jgi:hypothetical protein
VKILNFANCKSWWQHCIFELLQKTIISVLLILFALGASAALPAADTAVPNKQRVWLVGASQAALWAGTFVALNKAWYQDYPRENFHLFNDWPEWQQMDKAGHVWTSYQLSRVSGDLWKWTGVDERKAIWLGGASGVAFQSIIEILDGFSSEWGFSLTDMGANVAGSALYVSQALTWKQQRLSVKFSYFPYEYPAAYQTRVNSLFGAPGIERVLKDYNAQTYWISANVSDFFPACRIPKWLNISLGYNARLMLGGRENIWTDEAGVTYDYTAVRRYRRIFLSADIDLTRIRTKNPFLKSVFSALNTLKIPAPAIEYNTSGQWKVHGFYF